VIFTNYPIEKKRWVSILGADRVSRICEGWMFRRAEFHAVKESRQARLEGKNKEKREKRRKGSKLCQTVEDGAESEGVVTGKAETMRQLDQRARKQL
jgi:hypothetical protein